MAGDQKLKLNKQQLAAVKYKGGPLLIIAGAGTGKTTVITERIKHLIISKAATPSEILALTFTEKASREMEERVDIALPYGYTQMWISTFHSFCDRVLRDQALHIGLDPKYKLMTTAETVGFARNNLFKFKLKYFRPLGNPTKFIGGMLQHFSRLQDEDTSPAQYLRWARTQNRKSKSKANKEEVGKWMELASAYKTYCELKIANGVMDYGDLIVNTLKLFRERPNILKNYQKQFKHLLVDEYQDTNISQNELVKLLVKKSGNVTVVLDDDQSIYRFRGAAISNALQFRKSFRGVKVISLVVNYRSKQNILDKAYDLIQHNNPDRLEAIEKIDKRLAAARGTGGEVEFIHKDRVENEAEAVAKEILKLVRGKKYSYKDVSILVRANNHAEPIIRALGRAAIPYQFLGPGRLFRQPEVADLISYLKVLYNFEDSVSFYRVLSFEHFGIDAKDLAKMGNYARRFNLGLFDAAEKIEEIFVSALTKKKVRLILKIINKHLGLTRRETAGQLLYYFLEDTGLLHSLLNASNTQADKKAANISKFFDKLKTYEVDHEDASVTAVVDWLELASELGESPLAANSDWTEVDAVNILTVHSSKGLEFPIVFLINLVGQRFPSTSRREQIPIPDALIKEILPQGDYHLQEERRLFYVGMTRAEDRLYLTAADYYGEGKREKKLSPFIFEALGDEVAGSEQKESTEQLSFLDYKSIQPSIRATTKPSKIHIDYLSYSQIAAFKICPLHFKLRYVLKVPTAPSAALSFGSSIHNSLKDLYLLAREKGRPTPKTAKELLEENWIAEGYKNKSHERAMMSLGQNYLKGYLKQEFDLKNLPLTVEQPFMVPLNFGKGDRLKIGGKIDRIDPSTGSGRGGIEIVDYKTGGNIPTQAEVDKDLQLTFYALAASKIKDYPFDKKPGETKLSLYFLAGQKKISTRRTRAQLKEAEKEIFEWKGKIEKSDFKCSKHMFCQNCEFKMMCNVDS